MRGFRVITGDSSQDDLIASEALEKAGFIKILKSADQDPACPLIFLFGGTCTPWCFHLGVHVHF